MPDEVFAAVLCALAGVRTGDRVAEVGAGRMVRRALLAMSRTPELVDDEATVVVAGAAYEVPTALALLAPGGRLIAVAADAAAARRTAVGAGLELRHVERIGASVAWSAVRPAAP
ncbi:hypothetical protein BH24ACT10_BH24ACT10_15500 [soil metagenome]